MNLYQDLLERLQAATSDEERAWITLQFNLNTQTETVRAVVQAAAVLHWFDRAMLDFMLKTPLTEAEFRTLISLPYIEEFPERGWNVHEKARDLLRDRLWRENQARYRNLSRRAAAWCRKRQSGDPVWQMEATYHALLAEEKGAEQAFIDLGVEWYNRFQYAMLEALIRPLLNAISAGRLAGRAAAWAWLLQARLDIAYSRNRDAKIVLDKALTMAPGDKALTASCIEALGDAHQRLSELPQARRRYEEALPIYRDIGERLGEANCIKALGEVHQRLSELPQARRCYEEALPIYRDIGERVGEANCIQALGDVAGEEDKLDAALAFFAEAAQRFNALGLPADEAACYNSIGIMFNNSRRYPEALAAYGKAIELYPHVNYYTNRAEPHMHLGDYSAAQYDLDAAAALNPDYDYLHFNRGRLALWQGQAQAALAHFDQALAQRPEYGEFHLWRALALALSGAAWELALQAGLERTHLVRQIEETAEALDKLAQTYGAVASAGLRGALQAALAARVAASGQHVLQADADTRQT